MSTRHRSGHLKQTNKKHKTLSRGKRTQKKLQGGKVQKSASENHASKTITSKAERINRISQNRNTKRMEIILAKRLGSNHGPPRTIALIPLSDIVCRGELSKALCSLSNDTFKSHEDSIATHVVYSSLKSRCIFVEPRSRDPLESLELCKVCDMVVFITRESEDVNVDMIDDAGGELMSLIRSTGIPELACVMLKTEQLSSAELDVFKSSNSMRIDDNEDCYDNEDMEDDGDMDLVSLNGSSKKIRKNETQVKSMLSKHLASVLSPDCKIFDLRSSSSSSSQLQLLVRHICASSLRVPAWRTVRSYLFSESFDCAVDESSLSSSENPRLMIRGYLRGKPLNLNSLMHISNVGTCRIVRVEKGLDPFQLHKNPTIFDSYQPEFLDADSSLQDSLTIEASPNPIQGEQTWPSEDEMGGSIHENSGFGQHFSSNLTSSRLQSYVNGLEVTKNNLQGQDADDADSMDMNDLDENDDALDSDDGVDDDNEGDNNDDISKEFYSHFKTFEDNEKLEKAKEMSSKVRFAGVAEDDDVEMDHEVQEKAREDLEFPDEVDTPQDVSARDRFARYRALQSFRSSPWNPKENLPVEYSKIFQFENFLGTQKRILEDNVLMERKFNEWEMKAGKQIDADDSNSFVMDDSIRPGQYITIYVECTTSTYQNFLTQRDNVGFCTSFGLMKYENQISVLNFTIQRDDDYHGTIKGKDLLTFQAGFRSFEARPIFSESNLNCDKHKMDRFLQKDRFAVATCLGPITFGPCPVLIFKTHDDGTKVLVASGSLLSVDPDRIILKKVILTGSPVRVKKRFGVVKHMFYDPLDVKWFKPAELCTKYGLRGHIREAVGTHGLFKCQFNAPITQNDTVMLVLYKRVFPKFPLHGLVMK